MRSMANLLVVERGNVRLCLTANLPKQKGGDYLLEDFLSFLREDAQKEKTFILNPAREMDFIRSYNAIKELLERESIGAEISCHRGELINGYVYICIKADYVAVREMDKLYAAVVNADNFETYAEDDKVVINVMFHGVLTRI